jgi:hypothetical protein
MIEDIRIRGEDKCLYMPAFFTSSPMHTASLPGPCKAVPHFDTRNIWVAPTADEAKAIDSIQGRVVTMEGVPMYFKPRLDILTRIDEAGVTARLRVP